MNARLKGMVHRALLSSLLLACGLSLGCSFSVSTHTGQHPTHLNHDRRASFGTNACCCSSPSSSRPNISKPKPPADRGGPRPQATPTPKPKPEAKPKPPRAKPKPTRAKPKPRIQ